MCHAIIRKEVLLFFDLCESKTLGLGLLALRSLQLELWETMRGFCFYYCSTCLRLKDKMIKQEDIGQICQ